MVQSQDIAYAEAKQAIEAITKELLARQKSAVIAVSDSHGELIALARMDGAPLSSITIAMNKAWSAARERKPSADIGKAARNPEKHFDIGYFGDPKFTGWGGGIPVWRDGMVVGAVSVSGLPQEVDIELATLGAAIIEGRATNR
jgi:glc operon protein GlcG